MLSINICIGKNEYRKQQAQRDGASQWGVKWTNNTLSVSLIDVNAIDLFRATIAIYTVETGNPTPLLRAAWITFTLSEYIYSIYIFLETHSLAVTHSMLH